MPENVGLYQKYDVKRQDGQPDKPNAAYFVLDVVNDPFAQDALRCYRIACEGTLPVLARELIQLNDDLSRGIHDSPMVEKLRTPK